MCDSLLSEQTPQRLLAIRNNLYELLVHAIPPKTIIKSMVDYLVTRVDESLRIGIVEKAAFFEGRTKSSNKAIFHLEAFAVAVMTMIKSVS
jgi:replication factor C subunit 3/5